MVLYLAQWGLSWPTVLPRFWSAVLCGSAANIFIQFLNAKAASLDKGEVSLTAPLQAMTPGLITFLGLVLGEWPGPVGLAGVSLLMIGSYVLLWEKTPRHWYEYFGPLRHLSLLVRWHQLSAVERNKALVVLMALGSAALGTVGLLFDGLYTRRCINTQGLVVAAASLTLILTLTYVIWFAVQPDNGTHRAARRQLARQIDGKTWRTILGFALAFFVLAFGLLWVAQILLVQPVFKETFVAYVGSLKRFSILFSVLVGYLLFKESDFKQRFWAAILIVAGAVCISLDDLPGRVTAHVESFGF